MYLNQLKHLKKQNKTIAIVGLGKENIQFIEWLLDVVGFPPQNLILSDKNEVVFEPDLAIKLEKSTKIFGENYLKFLETDEIAWVFKAPGIHSLQPEFVQFRQKNGEWSVTSSLIFFVEKFRDKIIGVTGTKGKSTTSSLVTYLLKNILGLKVEYCGNTTGVSPYSFWTDLDLTPESNQYWVVELSSFQLQDLGFAKLSPARSVITNYYVDHLDQHNNELEYWFCKDQIFLHGKTFLVANEQIKSKSKVLENQPALFFNNHLAKLLLFEIKHGLPGEHNLMNIAEALAIVAHVEKDENISFEKVSKWVHQNYDKINEYLPSFIGLPHRFEKFRTDETEVFVAGKSKKLVINWIDDGYATEPDAVAAAINSVPSGFGNFLWLWLAGKDKGSNLKVIIESVLEKQLHSELYSAEYCGEVGKRILIELYESVGTKQDFEVTTISKSMDDLVKSISQISLDFTAWLEDLVEELKLTDQQDVLEEFEALEKLSLFIVLSPSGSSFDEFKNATERSNWWVGKVKSLK